MSAAEQYCGGVQNVIQYTARKEFQLPLFIVIDKVWDYIN